MAERTRFAPSPTGDLHLGGALVALASWVVARRAGGAFVLRVEDLDPPRVVAGSAGRIAEDLAWLGLGWDEGPDAGGPFAPYAQAERGGTYAAAVEQLTRQGLTYPCDCSRAEIARAASAPHAGEETVYPGTCRDKPPGRALRRPPALRLRVPDETVAIDDGCQGRFAQSLARDVGDYVLVRGDGVFSYQLAVAVDDWRMRVSCVVRGADLLASTPRQIHLRRLLGAKEHEVPRYVHLPLVVGPDGERLAKRTPGASVRALREQGVASDRIVGVLAHALGLQRAPSPCAATELSSGAPPATWPREALRVPAW